MVRIELLRSDMLAYAAEAAAAQCRWLVTCSATQSMPPCSAGDAHGELPLVIAGADGWLLRTQAVLGVEDRLYA